MRGKNGEHYYPIRDAVPALDPAVLTMLEHKGISEGGVMIVAKSTGERRTPKQGEWYISGAIPEAYRAPNDLTQRFTIARLVCVRRVEHYEEVR